MIKKLKKPGGQDNMAEVFERIIEKLNEIIGVVNGK